MPPPPPCDLLLFVAIPAELKALKAAALELGIPFEKGTWERGDYYNLGLVGTNRVVAVQTDMGPHAFQGSAAQAVGYRNATGATGLIGVGMAFGVDRKVQRIGDILISSAVLPYDVRTVKTGRWWRPVVDYSAVERYDAKASLLRMFSSEANLSSWRGRTHIGLILSGGARIQSRAYRDELRKECGLGKGEVVVGGDMESVGFLSASPQDDGFWVLVKAISDYADGKGDIRTTRPVACRNAAMFVLGALKGGRD